MLRSVVLLALFCVTSNLQAVSLEAGGAIAERLARAIEENYVEPETAREVAVLLREGSWAADSESLLASRFTELLRPFDGHFSVRYRPVQEIEDAAEAPVVDYADASRRRNYGFHRVEVLRGNIGYIDLREFASGESAARTAAGAMELVANSHALIFDLRRNGGGDPAMVQLLSSYLLAPGVHLNSLYWRPTDQTNQFWTLPALPGTRMTDRPVYVLIGPRTASAAEEFAYNLRALDRVILVGSTTYGAANPGASVDLGDGWSAFVSTGKAINPVTGSNWEGVGVEPHVEVSASQALGRAHELALAAALTRVDGWLPRQEIEWAQAAIGARRSPPAAAELERLAGRYGDRTISFDGTRLWYQRGGRMAEALLSASPTVHFLASSDTMRLRFEASARSDLELVEEFYDGFERSFERSARDPGHLAP